MIKLENRKFFRNHKTRTEKSLKKKKNWNNQFQLQSTDGKFLSSRKVKMIFKEFLAQPSQRKPKKALNVSAKCSVTLSLSGAAINRFSHLFCTPHPKVLWQ